MPDPEESTIDALNEKLAELKVAAGERAGYIGQREGRLFTRVTVTTPVGERALIIEEEPSVDDFTLYCSLTDSRELRDVFTMLEAYARGDTFVLLRTATNALLMGNRLTAIDALLSEYDREPMASARFVKRLREILHGRASERRG